MIALSSLPSSCFPRDPRTIERALVAGRWRGSAPFAFSLHVTFFFFALSLGALVSGGGGGFGLRVPGQRYCVTVLYCNVRYCVRFL